MSFSRFILSAIASIRSQFHLTSDQQSSTDARSFTYCWNYAHNVYGDFNVVEIEDLTVSLQLDDASLFLDTVEESHGIVNSQMVF